MSNYTPTTDEVRNAYRVGSSSGYSLNAVFVPEQIQEQWKAEFDRWLAEHDRALSEQRWDEGNQHGSGCLNADYGCNPYVEVSK